MKEINYNFKIGDYVRLIGLERTIRLRNASMVSNANGMVKGVYSGIRYATEEEIEEYNSRKEAK